VDDAEFSISDLHSARSNFLESPILKERRVVRFTVQCYQWAFVLFYM